MNEFEDDGEVSTGFDELVKLPPKYKVILLNDDFTTKEFVVFVLMRVFKKPEAEAESIMESVHRTGREIAGVYSYDIALTRREMTTQLARSNGFPLKCAIEKE